jgi:hypothetical protein
MMGGLIYAQDHQPSACTNVFSVGDVVRVTFPSSVIKMRPLREPVATNGTVILVFGQRFDVLGKTPSEVEKEIRKRYVPDYFAELKARVRLLRTNDFFYLNEKKLSCSLAGTVLEATDPDGDGFTGLGKKTTRVTVLHIDGTSDSLEFKRIQNDPNLDLEILPGDRLYTFPESTPNQWKPDPGEQPRVNRPKLARSLGNHFS